MRGICLFRRKLLVVAILTLTCGTAWADPLLRVFAIRGFAGVVFSQGLNQFCHELARIPQVACTVEDFNDASDIEGKASAAMHPAERRPGLPVVPAWRFYPRFVLQTLHKMARVVPEFWKILRTYRRVASDPNGLVYTDLAMVLVT